MPALSISVPTSELKVNVFQRALPIPRDAVEHVVVREVSYLAWRYEKQIRAAGARFAGSFWSPNVMSSVDPGGIRRAIELHSVFRPEWSLT